MRIDGRARRLFIRARRGSAAVPTDTSSDGEAAGECDQQVFHQWHQRGTGIRWKALHHGNDVPPDVSRGGGAIAPQREALGLARSSILMSMSAGATARRV